MTPEQVRKVVQAHHKETHQRRKKAFGEFCTLLRLALLGKPDGPSPWEIMFALGKEETLKRLRKAAE